MEPLVIVGLGNPGSEYAATRHNVGFRCVDRFAAEHGARFTRTACRSRLAEFPVSGRAIVLAKPRTFMNLSGLAAAGLVHSYRIPTGNLAVVHDDADLPLGKLRIRRAGSPAGHNGVKSIIEALHSDQFARFRVGIGRPDTPGDAGRREDPLIDHVLARFSAEEEAVIREAVDRVCAALNCLIAEGVDAAMNEFN